MSPSISIRLLLTQSDTRLVEAAREGHERAFEALVQRYRRPLLNYCRRLLLPSERAEDALQQGLLQAWLALQDGRVVHEPKAWLYRIVHNAALNTLRVSGYDYTTLNETLRGAEAPEHDLDRRIAVREALAGLAALPEMQREALLRTAVDGYSHEQVARALGLSEGALRGLVYRARAALRAATTALTPSPLVNWALNARGSTNPASIARLAEMGAGGGTVGIGGALLKGGALAVTAGALAGGMVAAHHPKPLAHSASHAQSVFAASAGTPATAANSALEIAAAAGDLTRTGEGSRPLRERGFARGAPGQLRGHGPWGPALPGMGRGDRSQSSSRGPDGQGLRIGSLEKDRSGSQPSSDSHSSSNDPSGEGKSSGGEGGLSGFGPTPSGSSSDGSGSSSQSTDSSTGSGSSGSGSSSGTSSGSGSSGGSGDLSTQSTSDGGSSGTTTSGDGTSSGTMTSGDGTSPDGKTLFSSTTSSGTQSMAGEPSEGLTGEHG